MITKKEYQFDAKVKLPVAAGNQTTPQDRDVWIDTAAGKLAYRLNGSTILIPLPSEITSGGLTEEQIEDLVAALIDDNSILDWTYVDNLEGPGSLVGTLKPGAVTNTELADMAQGLVKGRAAGALTGPPTDLTAAQVKTLLGIVSSDISDFVAAVQSSITVADSVSLDLAVTSGQITGAVLDSPLLGGQTKAQIQADIIAAISNGASAAYDTLLEIQNLLQADDTADALIETAMSIRSRFFADVLPSGTPSVTVTHNFNLTNIHDFIAKIVVAATGAEEEYAIVGATANTITVTDETGANIAAGRRIFLTVGV